MFTSKFIPVKVRAENETAVYSANNVFPANLLEQAHAFATNTGDDGNNVVIKNGCYTFKTNPECLWTLSDIVQAYESLRVARENNFSFFIIYNSRKTPNLYVSSGFNSCRILVNAFTMQSIVVSDAKMVRKLSSMLGNQYSDTYLINLFDMVKAVDTGRHKYLDGVIIDRYKPEATLAVNPLVNIAVDNGPWYDLTEIDELRKIVYEGVEETETFVKRGELIAKRYTTAFTPIGVNYAHSLIELCDRLLEKKTDYIAMYSEGDFEQYLYLSTNYQYLVKASTFECVTLKNTALRDWILSYTMQDYIPRQVMDTMWNLASSEVK